MAPKSLCLTTAFAPVPAFLGGSCPLGCSLSAPATGGCSVFSLQCNMYAAGSEKEKRAPGPLHRGTIAQLFVFCNGGVAGALPGRMVLLWRAPSISGGSDLACAAIPPAPPSNVFGNRGTPPVPPAGTKGSLHPPLGDRRDLRSALRGTRCTPAGAAPPAPGLGNGGGGVLSPGASGCFLTRGRERTPFLAFPRVQGQGQSLPPGARRH